MSTINSKKKDTFSKAILNVLFYIKVHQEPGEFLLYVFDTLAIAKNKTFRRVSPACMRKGIQIFTAISVNDRTSFRAEQKANGAQEERQKKM